MPIYEYRCRKGHTFETRQGFTDDPVAKCEVCGAPVQRVFHPVAVHFKGSGFYNTDYGTQKRSREKEAHESSKKEAAKASKDSKDSKDSSGGSSKDSKPSSGSDSGASKSDSTTKKSGSKAATSD